MQNNILIIGACGVGKTYVMQHIIKTYKANTPAKVGQLNYTTNGTVNVTGVYDGSTFQGSDRLSMSVMTSVDEYLQQATGVTFYEGDRFTNQKFIAKANPFIIRIQGNGEQGRKLRGSSQTDRQIKSIQTRVSNITPHVEVPNSTTLIHFIDDIVKGNTSGLLGMYAPQQQSLF